MLDINLFHNDKGGDPELIRESLRRRFGNPILVDIVIALDKEECKSSSPDEIFRLMESSTLTVEDRLNLDKFLQGITESVEVITRDSVLVKIGNLVHETVPVSEDEANTVVVRAWGEKKRSGEKLKNHVDLCRMLDIVAMEKGSSKLSIFFTMTAQVFWVYSLLRNTWLLPSCLSAQICKVRSTMFLT